jgi:Tol biopolymer transport system component
MGKTLRLLALAALAPSCKGNINDETVLVDATVRVSLSSTGAQADGRSEERPSLSADGRFVAFSSVATNLVPGDTNGFQDIFLHDRLTGTTVRVSVEDPVANPDGIGDGTNANEASYTPVISADGRYVAFASDASDLVAGDGNGLRDVFVWDRTTGTVSRISEPPGGGDSDGLSERPAISADGQFVAFQSYATNLDALEPSTNISLDIFRWQRAPPAIARVTVDSGGGVADGDSRNPSVSGAGRFVAFESDATDLLAASDTNGLTDIFLWDSTPAGGGPPATALVSVALGGGFAVTGPSDLPSISTDGRYIAFSSGASDLVAVDGNGTTDVFVRDTSGAGSTRLASTNSRGLQAIGISTNPALSGDGRFLSFQSYASNLVEGDTNGAPDVFLKDLTQGTTTRVSVRTYGVQTPSTQVSDRPAVSAAGRYVAFVSDAGNLVENDTNGVYDVFVRGP